jgi:hypothetical protein
MSAGRRLASYVALFSATLMAAAVTHSQSPAPALDSAALSLYSGVYQWNESAYVYLQPWEELNGFGKPMLVAFDESGEVRELSIRPVATILQRVPAWACRSRSNPAFSFNATPVVMSFR